MKNLILAISLIISSQSFAFIPNIFSSGEKITATKVNENNESLKPKIAYVQERYSDDTNFAPTVESPAVVSTRLFPLNTILGNNSIVSLNSGKLVLENGTYDISGFCMIYTAGTDSNASCVIREAVGQSPVVGGSAVYTGNQRDSKLMCLITASNGPKEYELVAITRESTWGYDANQHDGADEIIANIRIQKID